MKLMAASLWPLPPKGEPFPWTRGKFQGKPLEPLLDASPVELNLFSVLFGINVLLSSSPSLPPSLPRKERRRKEERVHIVAVIGASCE